MRIAVLGATGRTGVPLVAQALGRGHEVAALVRSPGKLAALPTGDPRLTVVHGDLLDAAAVSRVVAGADAVVDASGQTRNGHGDLRARAAALLIAAMREHGVRRLVALTGAGVRHPADRPKPVDRLIRGLLLVVGRRVLRDSEAYVRAVEGSGLDWTVVRAPRLLDADPRGAYRVARGVGRGTRSQLGRADLAAFLLDEVERPAHVGQMPVVSW